MRASARTRVTFVSAKVTKTIRSGTPSFGSPAFLSKAGAKRTRDLQSLKHLFAFSGFPCGTRWCPVAVGALFRLSAGARTAGESCAERARLPQVFLHRDSAFSVIAKLAWQGVAISRFRLPQSQLAPFSGFSQEPAPRANHSPRGLGSRRCSCTRVLLFLSSRTLHGKVWRSLSKSLH
jgi:hypothetical protein